MAGKPQRTKDQCRAPDVFSQLPLDTWYRKELEQPVELGHTFTPKDKTILLVRKLEQAGFWIRLPFQLMKVTGHHLSLSLGVRQVVREDEGHLMTTFQLKRSSCQRLLCSQHAHYGVERTRGLG